MELRWYQREAIEAIYRYLRERAGNPCAVLPTGAGKTPVLATLCRDAVINWNGRVLVLAHVKELLQQSVARIQALCPTIKVGLYSAGLKSRDTQEPIIVAGIQSVHDKANILGRFDLVIVDEAHLIPDSGEGMYRSFLADLMEANPDIRVIGLTATPFRLDSGPICKPDGLLNDVCYEVGIRPLIAQGHLSKLVGKSGVQTVDTRLIKVVRGEFDPEQAAKAFASILDSAVKEIAEKTLNRKSVLIFCQSIEHAETVAGLLRETQAKILGDARRQLEPARSLFDLPPEPTADDFTIAVAADYLEEQSLPVDSLRHALYNSLGVAEVYGDTKQRETILDAFKAGAVKYLVNVNVLTTGFDAPNVDCVVLLRSTVSAGLFYQMVGRGFRTHPGKSDCLVLDYGQNLLRHGPVDLLTATKAKAKRAGSGDEMPGKICPECQTVNASAVRTCIDCGHSFVVNAPEQGSTLDGEADDAEPVSNPIAFETHEVERVYYRVHRKKGADETAPKTMRVDYQIGLGSVVSEWVCVEHEGFALRKAQQWWTKHCRFPMPDTAVEAVQYGEHGLFANCTSIKVKTKRGERFSEIVERDLEAIPYAPEPCECGETNKRVIMPNDEIQCGWCGLPFRAATQDEIDHFGIYEGQDERIGLLPKELIEQVERDRSREQMLYAIPDDCPF